MPKKQYRIAVLFMEDRPMYLTAFLDMLRYDGAVVEKWERDSDKHKGLIEVTLVRDRPHTIERWRSFGINVAELLPRAW